MSLATVIIVAACFGVGAWLLMQPRLLHHLLGVCVLGHGANLGLVVVAAGASNRPALIAEGADNLAGAHADPLPQALVLTAIVIGFGVVAFGLALVTRTFREAASDDVDAMAESDGLTPSPSPNPRPTPPSGKVAA